MTLTTEEGYQIRKGLYHGHPSLRKITFSTPLNVNFFRSKNNPLKIERPQKQLLTEFSCEKMHTLQMHEFLGTTGALVVRTVKGGASSVDMTEHL